MASSNEKGELLEQAVQLIEETILKQFPGYSEAAFHISRRKIVVVDGVHHEIDVWVEVDLGKGYSSLLVFECKNWEAKVGKNEIIIFSDKIATVAAQHGYFVAREYTADARARADMDRRMTLLTAQEFPGAGAILSRLHFVGIGNRQKKLGVFFEPVYKDAVASLAIPAAKSTLNGEPVDMEEYASKWEATLIEDYNCHLPSNRMAEGVYPVSLSDERKFSAGSLLVNNLPVSKIKLDVTFDLEVVWPRISSTYDIATRGRVAFLEPIQLAGAKLFATAIGIDE